MDVIKSKLDIEDIFKHGTWYNHPLLHVLIKKQDKERGHNGRVAFIAGKKTGNAVKRNKAKRLLRESARLAYLPYDGYDIILIATAKTRVSSVFEITQALQKLLRRAGLDHEQRH